MRIADCGLRNREGEGGFGLYVHVPFCPQHCPYCAFTVLTGHEELYGRYVEAVCAEMGQWRHLASRGPVRTVFFGGGTPSMLSPGQVGRMLDAASAWFGIAADAEMTLEANPSTVDAARFAAIRQLGVNRLSLGVQSLNDADLKVLGRLHRAAEAQDAFAAARQAGFSNLSVDLMFSLPGAPRAHWRRTVEQVLALRPEHMSTYSLTIEEGTRFAQRHHQGRLTPVSEEDDAWAYAWVIEALSDAGYEHYEVSNFARPGFYSRHNWSYWHGVPYVGVGLSAHSFVDGRRRWNTRDMRDYLAAIEAGREACIDAEVIDAVKAREEHIFLQLRTSAGVRLEPKELHVLLSSAKFQAMRQERLVRLEAQRLSLTRQGFLLADTIGVDVMGILDRMT